MVRRPFPIRSTVGAALLAAVVASGSTYALAVSMLPGATAPAAVADAGTGDDTGG